MKEWIVIIAFLNGFIFGWIGGFRWSHCQWLHCAKNNIIMRIRGKHLYDVQPIKQQDV